MVERDNNGNESASENEVAPASDRTTYEAWWEPFPDNREPYYGGYNNKFDHAAACWLLFADRVFFNDGEITWDGKHHAINGVQINTIYTNQIPVLMRLRNNYMPAFLDLMAEIEKDEGLIIPRNLIHPVVQKALPKGNLTGITLMNLQACSNAVMIAQQAANEYFVIVDARVRSGIPDFTKLIGRLIWDLRAYNGVEAPFGVIVAGSHNIDANAFFGDDMSLDKPVAGASGEMLAMFTEKPVVHLPGKEEIEKASCPFASGMDHDGTTRSALSGVEASVPINVEMENDEELFELELYKLAESFPLTIPIEGTGYLGRVERIEDVKVGDPLVLASDWQSKYFSPCCIEVFNDKGETLGNLQEWRGSITNCGNRELALLLPYVIATVESVTPKSQRRKNAKYALMDVRLVLDAPILSKSASACRPEVLEKAKDTLRLPRAQRITMSKSALTCFDLKGNIDPSQMPKAKKRAAKKAEAPKKQGKSQGSQATKGAKTRQTSADKEKQARLKQKLREKVEACQRDVDEKKERFKSEKAYAAQLDKLYRRAFAAWEKWKEWKDFEPRAEQLEQELKVAEKELDQLRQDYEVATNEYCSLGFFRLVIGEFFSCAKSRKVRKLESVTQQKEECSKKIQDIRDELYSHSWKAQPELPLDPEGEKICITESCLRSALSKLHAAKDQAWQCEKEYNEACEKLEKSKNEYKKKTGVAYRRAPANRS